MGGYADGFLETTIEDVISKRYDVEVDGLGRVVPAGGGQKGICHDKLFSCFFLSDGEQTFLVSVRGLSIYMLIFLSRS